MAELKFDEDLLRDAASQAILTMLGPDKGELLSSFIVSLLERKGDQYGSNKDKSRFQVILQEQVERYAAEAIREFIVTNDDGLRKVIQKRLTPGVLGQVADSLIKKSVEAIDAIKASRW